MQRNISDWERAISLAAGGALFAYALSRTRGQGISPMTATTATGLIARGLSGFCPLSATVGRNSRGGDTRAALGGSRGLHVHESVTIGRPAPELFRFWRDFSNLPRFMDHLEDVRIISPTRSVWTAKAPAGLTIKWEADVINEIEGELIGWQSTDNADVATAGSVRFVPAPRGGTEIIVHLQYEPPAGKVGGWIASLFGEEPSQQIRADLRKLKALLETGEAPSIVGQPAGPSGSRRTARAVGVPV
ncbi:MAG TPA: SRPBCC family protein [Vicinamibacterales bacterium]|nr:SRPBCC family protein [Vicinamibacterales bacterium]